MRSLKFVRLFKMLFMGKSLPDIKKIEKMGLLAVKIGQMYALRSDFLDPKKCQHLMQLYESVTAVSPKDFDELLEKNAPTALKRALTSVDKTPLASASIGQVHKAVLKSGETVVIKLIKGDFKDEFLKDIKAVRGLAKKAIRLHPKIESVADPMETIDTIERLILTELDLRNEIKGIERLAKIRDAHKAKFPYLGELHFPRVYEELSNEKVFVSEFIGGKSFGSLLEEGKLKYEQLLELFRIHGFYVFLQGEFHGDLHPGNVFLDGDRLVFLDNANVESVPPHFGQGIVSLLFCLADADWAGAAQVLHETSSVKLKPKRLKNFERRFVKLYKDFDQKTVSEISLTTKMMETVKLAIDFGMEFESGMFSVVKTLMYLDGMVIKCNPDAVLLKDVAEFKEDFMLEKKHKK